ncbi:hypothetical protein THAOC_23796, partial [Thalassiosira oceanica]
MSDSVSLGMASTRRLCSAIASSSASSSDLLPPAARAVAAASVGSLIPVSLYFAAGYDLAKGEECQGDDGRGELREVGSTGWALLGSLSRRRPLHFPFTSTVSMFRLQLFTCLWLSGALASLRQKTNRLLPLARCLLRHAQKAATAKNQKARASVVVGDNLPEE